jgi:hypothetical protein
LERHTFARRRGLIQEVRIVEEKYSYSELINYSEEDDNPLINLKIGDEKLNDDLKINGRKKND